MSTSKNKTVIILVITAIMIMSLIFYLFFGHILIYALSKKYNLDITYGSLTKPSASEFMLKKFGLGDRLMGFSLSSKTADIKIETQDPLFRDMAVDFNLQDVYFSKISTDEKPAYDTLTSLVSVPFDSRWAYQTISGKVKTSKNRVEIKDLIATGKDIKLLLSGTIDNNNLLNLNLVIYFSNKVRNNISKDLARMLLSEPEDGWSSLSVHLEGDYKIPSISLSSKMFRLNIRAVSGI